MSYSLAVADLRNGSGASVTVTPDDGDDYKIQRAVVTAGAIGSYTDAVAGFLSGTQTVTVAGLGYYMWRVVDSVDTVLAGPLFRTTSVEGDCPWIRSVTMIADRIRALGLPVIASDSVLERIVVDLDEVPMTDDRPILIVVSPLGNAEQKLEGPLGQDDIGYPIGIEMLESMKGLTLVDGGLQVHTPRWYSARHRIDRAIDQQRWDLRVPEVSIVRSITRDAIERTTLLKDRVRRGLIDALCVTREDRGLIP